MEAENLYIPWVQNKYIRLRRNELDLHDLHVNNQIPYFLAKFYITWISETIVAKLYINVFYSFFGLS